MNDFLQSGPTVSMSLPGPSSYALESATASKKSAEVFLTVQEVANLLRIFNASVYQLVERRVITVHRFTRRLRFKLTDVEKYIEQNADGSQEI